MITFLFLEVKEDYNSFGEIILSTTDTCKLRNDTTHKRKLECLEGIRNMVQTIRRCQHETTKDTVNLLGIHPKDAKKHENKALSFDDPPITCKSVSEVKGKYNRNNSAWKKQAPSVEHGGNLVGRRIKVWWQGDKRYYEGVVNIFDVTEKKHKVLYDDGDEELLNLKTERWKLLENVSAKQNSLGHAHPTKVSSPQGGMILVQGYKVKQSVAPILEAIFKKHGDIVANCVFKSASVRSSFLEEVCEVVRRIQTRDIIEKMEEIECQVSDIEVASIDVSWLRAHLKAFHKMQEATKKSSLLMEMKASTILVKRAAEKDLRESCLKLLSAKEQFEKADRCVRVLQLVEKNLNKNILESKAEIELWVEQPIMIM